MTGPGRWAIKCLAPGRTGADMRNRSITVKNEACLPDIDDLFDTIQCSKYFSKLDLRSGYNQVRIREEDVHKTAFNTPLDHFQFKVMGFGLCNAPATFQSLMTQILRPYLLKFVGVFLDDILIFSSNWKERTLTTCAWFFKLFENINFIASHRNACSERSRSFP